jgi:NAD(P)-dependent dehydrogenase (short-subunit alcohol dehydrogenase family)
VFEIAAEAKGFFIVQLLMKRRRIPVRTRVRKAVFRDLTSAPQFYTVTSILWRILVNNAGITQPKRIDEISEDDYDAVLDVNLRGTFLCSKAVIPHMRKAGKGSIVSMSSVSAKRGGGVFGGSHYSAAKAGIIGLTRAMARELAPEGIRVNAVAPGLIDTDITKGKLSPELKAQIIDTIPMKRMGLPIDVARACLFFASELSSYVTGEIMDVNGGMYID